jgi:subtilisin-like proprotein convertase family protein
MKPLQTYLAVLLLACATAQAGLITYDSGFQNGGVIPDANPTGWSDTRTVSDPGSVINNVSVIINVSGGYNGDLYAYLSHNGTLVTLLNRVGTGSGDAIQQAFGFSTAGFSNVRLDGTGSLSIHDVANPDSSPTSYMPDGGSLASFNGQNPNGNWTIFFSDMASGGGSSPSTLVSWSLDITAVPEPVNMALGLLGGVFFVVVVARSRRVRDQIRRWRDGFVRWVNAV